MLRLPLRRVEALAMRTDSAVNRVCSGRAIATIPKNWRPHRTVQPGMGTRNETE